MRSVNQCPVTHITLHSLLKEFEKSGILETREIYRPGFGISSRYLYNGEFLEFKMGFVGKIEGFVIGTNQPTSFYEPHDIAYVPSTNVLVAFARSA